MHLLIQYFSLLYESDTLNFYDELENCIDFKVEFFILVSATSWLQNNLTFCVILMLIVPMPLEKYSLSCLVKQMNFFSKITIIKLSSIFLSALYSKWNCKIFVQTYTWKSENVQLILQMNNC